MASTSAPSSEVFRTRAEECREIAGMFHTEKPRHLILKVADEYERMADRAEAIELKETDRAAAQRLQDGDGASGQS